MSTAIKSERLKNEFDPESAHKSDLKGNKEVVLGDKNGNHVRERKWKHALRKRNGEKGRAKSEVNCNPKAAEISPVINGSKVNKKTEERSDEENAIPGSKSGWRSRCGRKRKYFGHDSERQGATKRERKRFNIIQEAFQELRKVIPKAQHPKDGNLSKYATLKLATTYISLLSNALASTEKMDEVRQDLHAFEVSEYGRRIEDDANFSSGSGISEDELFKGDLSDMLCVAEEIEGSSFYDEIAGHTFEACETGSGAARPSR